MWPYLKLLSYFHAINLSAEETFALMRRLETDSCRAEDYEVLMRIVRAHIDLSADVMEVPPGAQPSLPALKATGKQHGGKRARPPRR